VLLFLLGSGSLRLLQASSLPWFSSFDDLIICAFALRASRPD
jgi:hypothetical protein